MKQITFKGKRLYLLFFFLNFKFPNKKGSREVAYFSIMPTSKPEITFK